MKKMAVIRGTEARPSQVYFYNHFKKLAIKFIGHKIDKSFYPLKKIAKIEYVQSPLKPAWLIDPARFIYKKTEHHSWAYHQDLEKHIDDCDVLNITDCFYFFCRQTALLAQKLKKPLVTTVWETFPGHPSVFIPPYCFNVWAVLKTTKLFIARSQKSRLYLNSLGVADKKIKVIYKGVDLNHFYPCKRKNWKGFRILYVGQLVKTKGVDDLLTAFKKLYQEKKDVKLWIGGNGPLRSMVLELAKRAPVKYLGHVKYSDLPQIYQQCDIFCSLSKDFKYFGFLPGGEEWFSYTLMEAMASGLPVVANFCGGVKEEVGSQNLLVRQGDVSSLAEVLSKLVADSDFRQEIGRLNRQRAEKFFDAQKQARKTETAILKLA